MIGSSYKRIDVFSPSCDGIIHFAGNAGIVLDRLGKIGSGMSVTMEWAGN